MRLLSSNFSPYATRVRIQIAKNNLPIEVCAPEPALRTPEFFAKYPLGKIPVLELDDGQCITESWVIMEYLEQTTSGSNLSPSDAFAKAQMSMLGRYADLHLGPSLFPMFKALLMKTDIDAEQEVNAIKAELAKGEQLLKLQGDFQQRSLNLGDIALATTMYFTIATPKIYGCENILADFETLSSWWAWVLKDEAVKQGIDEMQAAFMAFGQ
ncbi:glutathione S-transferase family protein [Thalassomonas sp. M1454]|uniref:glutathione S-transferase family protein n=1 Tax=Thalassomonas sp. M1454 TaxID=2594477 RepID=UPI00117E8AB2|nr:glutathione S-transferase family protein [Thalassomonas sp. M1454]TRX55043.1 glutathione S-transferase family protein [Thalassomonas sp. M1454]